MELWGEIFTLEEKRKEELENKCAEWREVEPLLNEGLDAVFSSIKKLKKSKISTNKRWMRNMHK
jgi:hypothetical protein